MPHLCTSLAALTARMASPVPRAPLLGAMPRLYMASSSSRRAARAPHAAAMRPCLPCRRGLTIVGSIAILAATTGPPPRAGEL